jgi:very-short-patch-repair endonuclease
MDLMMLKMRSKGEEVFKCQCNLFSIEMPIEEYRFHPTRRWRFDFAWPQYKIAVEIEGGIYSKGRHTRGQGYANDCNKYNSAVELGWSIYRYPTNQVLNFSAIKQISRILSQS